MMGFGEAHLQRLRQTSNRALAEVGAEPATAEVPTFSVVHAEGLDGLCQTTSFGLTPPFPIPGKPTLRDRLHPTGVDVSFVKVLPWEETPYEMRHRRNEVVYIVAAGRGQFLVDREVVEVNPGTVLRVRPECLRAWRNVSSEDLLLIVIQGQVGALRRRSRSDAIGQPGLIPWWRYPRARSAARSSTAPRTSQEDMGTRPRLFGRFSKPGKA
ncbi:cupin domain-containing protein [Singulisphaera acidiphila]|uniref:Cupin domain-containing protein n=1 Tax=Singulisphaera acidiphila (strain ATCC BAA-1392 / DSM 18658 / VKM B-2454 / MOB10) TaxID=886293 RepID=L0DPG7_SINAD|nr:cupin domain-containing protein [Singulisphaera acidiphila]AGA30710.1 cupin domain-containing protein [Singulisphaera acidiphila DSM 18658]